MADPLLYTFDLSGMALIVRRASGREALSEPFRLELFLHLDDGVSVDPDAAIRQAATLALARAGVERRITGVITEIVVGEIAAESETGARTLTAVIEPTFALARLKKNTKAFLYKSVVDIVTEVLSELGVTHALRLASSYPVRPYTVQFGETDFHFVSRMLEEEGIFYFFAEDGTMILADDKAGYDAAGALPFRHAAGADEHQDSILAMGARGAATASRVSLRDWTADAPSRPMDVEAAGPRSSGPEHYDFPGEYVEPGHGQRIANRMAGALACEARGYGGRASAARLAPGRTFDLWSAPVGLSDGEYVVKSVEHDYERTREGFSVRFEAFDGDVVFRAPIRHEEPILPNPVIGEVVGPPGSDIHTDELGRVKVHFRWDRLQPKDDTCSHWLPVLQDNLAHSVAIPRVGWEVLVHFLEGDPDRPVVLGRVYNGEDRFHMALPDKKTITALRSLSSPSRDGQNFVELEDMQGRENINIHAERNQDVVVVNDKTEHVMAIETHEIDHDESITIGNDEEIAVTENDATPVVDGDRTVAIAANRTREIGSDDSFSVGGNRLLSIGGKHSRKIARNDNVAANTLVHSVGGVILEASVKPNSLSAKKASLSAVGGLSLEVAGGEKSESGKKLALDLTGGVVFIKAKDTIQTKVVKNRFTLVGAAHKTKAEDVITLSGAESFKVQTLAGTFDASESLTLEVGDTVVALKEGQIMITTKTSITTTLADEAMLGAEESSHISAGGEG